MRRCRYLLVVFLAGCAGDIGEGTNDDGGNTSNADGLSNSGNSSNTSNNSSSNSNQPAPDGAVPTEVCKRVDLVIAVDDSGSMTEETAAMRDDVFPKFAKALRAVGGGLEDYRIGVLDACPDPANFHTRGEAGACDFESGEVWMDSASSQLEAEFACVGDIWSGDANCTGNNDDKRPASAVVSSLTPPFSDGPNAGFLRDDALLVVIVITDEDERPIPDATAEQIYDRLVAIKGDVRKMVLLGIGGSSNCTGAYGDADRAEKLIDLTDLFIAQKRGVFWDLCQGQLEDGLTAAMEVIEEACNELPTVQ